MNTQMKTESCRTFILIKELCRQCKYFQNHIIDSLYKMKGYSNISHLRIQWCTPKYGKHLKYWIWWWDSFQSKSLFHYFFCVSNLSIYLCYIMNLLDFSILQIWWNIMYCRSDSYREINKHALQSLNPITTLIAIYCRTFFCASYNNCFT